MHAPFSGAVTALAGGHLGLRASTLPPLPPFSRRPVGATDESVRRVHLALLLAVFYGFRRARADLFLSEQLELVYLQQHHAHQVAAEQVGHRRLHLLLPDGSDWPHRA